MTDNARMIHNLHERIKNFIGSCCSTMEAVKDGEPYVPVVAVYREGLHHPAAIVMAPGRFDISPMEMMSTFIGDVARGFDGNLLVLVMDSYGTDAVNNPTTGRPWRSGEMGQVLDVGNPDGVVYEALAVTVTDPDGLTAFTQLRYHRHGTEVEWLDGIAPGAEEATNISGRVPSMAQVAWDGPPLRARSPEDRLLKDLALTELLTSTGLVVLSLAEKEMEN